MSIVLKVIKQHAATEACVTPAYIKQDILPEFFKAFQVQCMVLDRQNYHQVMETKVEVVQKAGVSEIIGKIVNKLIAEAEPCHKMVMGAHHKICGYVGCFRHQQVVENVTGQWYYLQEQMMEDQVMYTHIALSWC